MIISLWGQRAVVLSDQRPSTQASSHEAVHPHHLLPLPFYLHLMQCLRVRNWHCLHANKKLGTIAMWLPSERDTLPKIVLLCRLAALHQKNCAGATQ